MKLKNHTLTIACILFFGIAEAQPNMWTWVKGANTANQPATYGTQGVAAPTNDPGQRNGSAFWKDNSGNFWMFGGNPNSSNNADNLSDLWKYDLSTNNWTWVKGPTTINQSGIYGTMGVASPSNNPGARGFSANWTDAAGNLWLFGGWGYNNSGGFVMLNDLWKYTITTNQWTWMKGSTTTAFATFGTQGVAALANTPGSMYSAACWVDNNFNFWLACGVGNVASGTGSDLSDVWKYNSTTNMWTWVKGPAVVDDPAVYGTKGVPAAGNTPGGRRGPSGTRDASGNFWLLGGFDYAGSSSGRLNDLWKYDIVANQWTWFTGVSTLNIPGSYGTQGVPSATNTPGARNGAAAWLDNTDVYFFGGSGYDWIGSIGFQGDLWKYSIPGNTWTWVKGPKISNQGGINGTIGVPATTNNPGSRYYPAYWKDNTGKFWMHAGAGYAGSGAGMTSDLWTFSILSPLAIQEEVFEDANSLVYPNPASTELKINNIKGLQKLELYNTNGQLVLEQTISETDLPVINVNNFSNGIYFLKAQIGSKTQTQKVIIQK